MSKPVESETGKPPTISAKQMFDLFMCGAPTSYTEAGTVGAGPGIIATTRNTRNYCNLFYGDSKKMDGGQSGGYDWWVYECPRVGANNEQDNWETCLTVKVRRLHESDILRGSGFLAQTETLLLGAVNAVKNNDDKFDPRFLKLVQTVNFPLYQAVNAAAIYPASTGDLMTTMSVMVAESLVYAKLEEITAPQGRNPNDIKIKAELAKRVYEVLENMNRMHLSQREAYGRMMTVQEGAMHSIRQINLAIQKQVMTPALLGNVKFTEATVNAMSEKKP